MRPVPLGGRPLSNESRLEKSHQALRLWWRKRGAIYSFEVGFLDRIMRKQVLKETF